MLLWPLRPAGPSCALCLLPPLYGPRLAPPVIIAGSFTTSLGLQRVHLGIPGWASWEAISKVESVCQGLLRERRAAGWGKSGGDVGPRLAPAGPAERSRANEPFRVVTGGVEMLRPFCPSPAPCRGHVCVLPHEPSSQVRLLSPPHAVVVAERPRVPGPVVLPGRLPASRESPAQLSPAECGK